MKNIKLEMRKHLLKAGYREFDSQDFMGFADALPFEDGSVPIIYDDDDDQAYIYDNDGLSSFNINGDWSHMGIEDPKGY